MTRLLLLIVMCMSSQALADEFRVVDADNLVNMQLDTGNVLIELIPEAAPKHVAQFKQLIREGKYNNQTFYRVIEGFVAQGGLNLPDDDKSVPTLPMESEFSLPPNQFTEAQTPDMFAPVTGFYQGFAVAAQSKLDKAWLTHCPGTLAMARGNEPDSGSSDFYFVIGQAPRYLDRIMTIFGRVVDGFDAIQSISRGRASNNGIIADEGLRTRIKSVQVMSDLPLPERPLVEVIASNTESFKAMLESRKHRTHPFFYVTPPAVLDVCQIPLQVKINGQST